MQRRVLLAFFLSFVVLYAYQALFVPTPPNRGAPGGLPPAGDVARPFPADEPAATGGAATGIGSIADPTPPPVAPPAEAAVPEGEPVTAAAAVESIVVESDALRAVFTNRGAALVSWELRDYLDEISGEPVDLVPRELPAQEPAPFSVAFADPALTARAAAGLYRASAGTLRIRDRAETLAFEFEDAGGLRVRKEFRFDPAANPFVVTVSVDAALSGQPLVPIIRWGPALGGVESSSSGLAYRVGPRGVMYGRVQQDGTLSEEEVERPDASDVTGRPTYEGLLRFAGVDNHYFLAAALPGNAETVVRYRAVPLPPLELDGDARELMAFDVVLPGSAPDIDLPFFLGPKDFEILEAAHPALVRSLDFGWFAWLVVPLHRSLTWVHDYVGNWGWAIIVLTILINLVILPLRHKSVVSIDRKRVV